MIATALKDMARGLLVNTPVWSSLQHAKSRRDLANWQAAGRPVPPPHVVKQRTIAAYAARFGTRVFIETGTFKGDMLFAMKDRFERLISIELSERYWSRARERFRTEPRIELLKGDSGEVLPRLLTSIDQPCVFWLDGHFSAGETARAEVDTPISVELEAVLRHRIRDHVVLIDDARLFDGTDGYPVLNTLREHVLRERADCSFTSADDMIRIHTGEPFTDSF